MQSLLQDADRDRLVLPLAELLPGDVELGGQHLRALAEAPGSARFPAEGNALAAELLLMPGLRATHAPLGEALLDFCMAMADAVPACRSAVAGRVEVASDDPRAADVANPFFRLAGDLTSGVLRQVPLPPGGPALRHGGNLVEFRIGRHRSCADVEDAITEAAVERRGGAGGEHVVLRHAGTIRGKAGLFSAREVEAGRLEIAYAVAPDSPVLRVTVRFTAARRLAALRLTTALDAVAEEGLAATGARLHLGGAWRDAAPPAAAGATRWAEGEPLAHLALGTAGFAPDAPSLHLRPLQPARVASVTAEARQGGALHWLLLRHGPASLRAGETLVVEEDRLLVPGGDVAEVAGMMQSGARGLDLEAAPPSGAVLNAVATALLLDALGLLPERLPAARRAALGAFADRHAARIEAASLPAQEIGWAALAADTLRRGRGGVVEGFRRRSVARLAALVEAGTGLVRGKGEGASLAAQALAILALARAATWADSAEAAGALARALAALRTGGAEDRPAILLAGCPIDPAGEASGLALLVRATAAVPLAAGAALDGARELHRVAVNLLRPLVRPRGRTLQVLARGPVAPGPQALVALALMAPDRLMVAGCVQVDAVPA